MGEIARRDFLSMAAGLPAFAAARPALEVLDLFAQEAAKSNFMVEVDARYYKKLSDRKVQCFVCPGD